MKKDISKKIMIPVLIVVAIGAMAGAYILGGRSSQPLTVKKSDHIFGLGRGNGNSTMNRREGDGQIDRKNCLADECLEVDDLKYPAGELDVAAKEALGKALDDEYKAFATYQKVLEKQGMVRPFSMIIRAEENHISSLKSLFDKYGISIPENKYIGKMETLDTLSEACAVGVDAEIANAALYRNELLGKVSNYPDITTVFTNLMSASQQKHLSAFQRCAQ